MISDGIIKTITKTLDEIITEDLFFFNLQLFRRRGGFQLAIWQPV